MPPLPTKPTRRYSLAESLGINDPLASSPLASATATSVPQTVAGGKMDLPRVGALSASANAVTRQRNSDALDPALRALISGNGAGPTLVGGGVIGNGGAPNTGPRLVGGAVIEPAGADGFTSPEVSPLRTAIDGLPTSLTQYNDAQDQSIDRQIALQQGYLNNLAPVKDGTLAGFAEGLLQNTTTGSFAEGLGNAFSAANRARSEYNKEAAAREEKLLNSQLALERMQALKARDPMEEARTQYDLYKMQREAAGYVADDALLANGLTPADDEALITHYKKNPSKYAGSRGQAMVADAIDRQRSTASAQSEREWELRKMAEQSRLKREEEVAKAAAEGGKPTPLDRAEANRVSKRLAESQTFATTAEAMKSDIASLRQARSATGLEGVTGADAYASYGAWLGLPGASELQTVRSRATDLQLNLADKLKGATSDRDMTTLQNATAGIGMEDAAAEDVLAAQEAAAQRAIEKNMFLKRWVQVNGNDYGADEMWAVYTNENPLFSEKKGGGISLNKSNVSNWRNYVTTPDGGAVNASANGASQQGAVGGVQPLFDVSNLPPNVLAWAERQLQLGNSPKQIIRHINDQIAKQQKGTQ